MIKGLGWSVASFDRSIFKFFTLNFQRNRCSAEQTHPVRNNSNQKLFSEPCFYYFNTTFCFCHLKSIICSLMTAYFGGVWKNQGNLQAMCLIYLNNTIILWRLSKYRWELSHFLKRFIMESRCLLLLLLRCLLFFNIGEDIRAQYRCFS